MLTEIKEEPEDYEEMEMSCNIDDIDDDVDDDDDDDDEEIEEEDDSDDNDEDNEDDYEEDDEEEIDETGNNKQEEIAEDNEPSDVRKMYLVANIEIKYIYNIIIIYILKIKYRILNKIHFL